MTDPMAESELLLPERARLLHIGPMKTGTTALQNAARNQRAALLANGVRYPGKELNHRVALGALFGWSVQFWNRSGPITSDLLEADTRGVPAPSQWDKFQQEITAETTRRILISHEYFSQADDQSARLIVDELGPEPVHVAITLRPPAAIVPSLWAQGLRDDGEIETLEAWLDRVYGKNPDPPMPERFQRAYDHGELVRRWARIVGPENVTVIVADPGHGDLITDTFEGLLGLPSGTLSGSNLRQDHTNRALTAVEAELFRRLNVVLRAEGVNWRTYYKLVRHGANRRLIGERTPPDDEPPVRLPDWAAEIARKDGQRFAEAIGSSRARVVGDLDHLHSRGKVGEAPKVDEIPVDIGVDSLAGSLIAGERAEKRAGKRSRMQVDTTTLYQKGRAIPARDRAEQLSASFTTRELAAAVKRRLAHRLRTRRPKPLTSRADTRR